MRSRLASTLIVFLALSLLPAGASGGDGNSAVSTPPGQALPLNTAPPLITGTASQDQTLSADPGTWSGPNPTYAAQWLGCDTSGSACTPIASAASLTYRPTSADVGRRLRVAVVVTNKNGSAVATSDALLRQRRSRHQQRPRWPHRLAISMRTRARSSSTERPMSARFGSTTGWLRSHG